MAWINIDELEAEAKTRLGRMAWDYYSAGSDDMVTLSRNREAYRELSLRFRVLRDVSQRSLKISALGSDLTMPILIAPTAFHGMAHADGETATAAAADDCGTAMIVSTLSNRSIEEIAAAGDAPLWFQLYIYKDRVATQDLVKRAEDAGCRALVLTVDAALWGRREPDIRNGFGLPPGLSVKNLTGSAMQELPQEAGGSGLSSYIASFFDPSVSWKDLEWLCGLTRLPVLVKGVVRGDDAAEAMARGAAGVVVSNHGGRQLDTSPATIEVLAEVVDAVDGRGEVYVDGGIRRGTDVVKALALGARGVLVGRPTLWGLAVDGREGVRRMLMHLREETDLAMGLCGATHVGELDRSLVVSR